MLFAVELAVAAACVARAAPATAESHPAEAEFLARTNALRLSKGVAPLVLDSQLADVARYWSRRMATNGALSHNPDLETQVSNWRRLGENVGSGPTVATVQAEFEANPHHYANLVDPRFDFVGVGVVQQGSTLYVTVDFKQAQNVAAAPAPPAPVGPEPRPGQPKPPLARSPSPSPAPTALPVASRTNANLPRLSALGAPSAPPAPSALPAMVFERGDPRRWRAPAAVAARRRPGALLSGVAVVLLCAAAARTFVLVSARRA